MDLKALFNLTYGLFVLSTKNEDIVNGSIINTCMQIANDPTRIAISCINGNYTTELIKQSRVFSLSILDESCPFGLIEHFGYHSGRDVDKFKGLVLPKDLNEVPYLDFSSCAMISATVLQAIDLGSHTMFIAQIEDAKRLSSNPPMTYSYYQNFVKPKPSTIQTEKEIIGYRCKICGYVYDGKLLPVDFVCPLCGHDISDFEPVYKD